MTRDSSPITPRSQLLALDTRLSQRLAQLIDSHPFLRPIAIVLAHSGDSPLWVVGLGLLWWFGSSVWRREAQLDLLGVLLTAIVVQLIKWRVKRPRPVGEWGNSYRKLDPHSFPSGHAARAIMLAVVAVWTGPWWWAIALVIWAPLVSLARVSMRVHYLSDVAVGAFCGLVCGVAIWIAAPF